MGLQCVYMVAPKVVCCCSVQYLVQNAWSMATLGHVGAAPLLEAVIGRAASDPLDQVLFHPNHPLFCNGRQVILALLEIRAPMMQLLSYFSSPALKIGHGSHFFQRG